MQKINKNGFESYLYVYVRVHSETASGRKENGWAAEQVCVCAHLSAPLAPECSCSSSAPLRSETVAATWQSAQAAKRHKYQQSDLETFCSNITYTTLCFSLSPSKLKQQQTLIWEAAKHPSVPHTLVYVSVNPVLFCVQENIQGL